MTTATDRTAAVQLAAAAVRERLGGRTPAHIDQAFAAASFDAAAILEELDATECNSVCAR